MEGLALGTLGHTFKIIPQRKPIAVPRHTFGRISEETQKKLVSEFQDECLKVFYKKLKKVPLGKFPKEL